MLDIYFFFLGRESSLLLGAGEAGGGKSSAVNPEPGVGTSPPSHLGVY